MNTIATFDHRPSPSHSMRSGKNTSRGVALNAVMNGSNIALSVRDRPIRTPSGSPTRIARPRPSAKPEALTPSGTQIVPVANICQSVPAIWLGVVKNSLVPGDSVTRRGTNSHTRRSATMLPAPSSVGSRRCHTLLVGTAQSSDRVISASIARDSLIALLSDPPRERRAFRPPDPLGEHDCDHHDGEDAGEHPVEGKQIAEAGDRIADAFRGGEELADQYADQAAADCDARAGDEIGQHARDEHLDVEILLAAAERADDVDQQAVDRAHAGTGVEDEGEDRER